MHRQTDVMVLRLWSFPLRKGNSCKQLQAQNCVSGVARCWFASNIKVIEEIGVSIESEIMVRLFLPEGIVQS